MDFSTITHISYSNAGIDTDTIVQKLMQAEQVPLDQLKQKQQKDLWLSDAYRQWNTNLFSFNNDTVFNMKLSASYNTFDVTAPTDNSVSGTATANALEGTYTLAVNKLAAAPTLMGNKTSFSTTDDLLPSNPATPGTNADGSLSINISINDPNNSNGTETGVVTIPKDAKISDVVSAFNKVVDNKTNQTMGIQAMYDSTLQQFIIKTNSTGAATKIDLSANGTGTAASNFLNKLGLTSTANVATGSTPINISSTSPVTLTNSTISIGLGSNSPASIPINGTFNSVQAYVDEINKQISLSSGIKGQVTASYDQNNNLQFISTGNSLTVTSPSNDAPGIASTTLTSQSGGPIAVGANADITFTNNGTSTEITNLANNSVTLLGVNYTLKNTTTSAGDTITVSRNIDKEVKNIEDFISKYNDTLGKLNSAVSEPVYSSYQPLTDDQRAQMTDTQITQWETKAKSGLMNNDSILSGLVSKVRSAMTSFVNNGSTYNSLASIGITSHSWSDQGKLYVDEDKLRTALQTDPNGVARLFSQMGDGVGDQTGKQGVVQSLSDALSNAYTQLVNKAGSTSGSQYDQSFLGKDLSSLQTQIADMTTKLQAKEQSYYNQYDAMQQAVSQFQSQGSMLAQSLGLSTTR